MLLVCESGVEVIELHRLCELSEVLDSKIYEIVECISKSVDPESDGLLDQAEYFIGVGFVAIQQYLNDSLIGININKKKALSLGTIHSSGATSVSVINAAANWWKHEAEWFKNGNVPKNGERTVEIIMGI